MPTTNCRIFIENISDGTSVIRVTDEFTTNADKHAFNKKVDELAPKKSAEMKKQTYIIDLSAVTLVGKPGIDALMFAIDRFKTFGAKVAVFARQNMVSGKWWGENMKAKDHVFTSFQEAMDSLNPKTETEE